jgi:hypothetical protein
MKRDGFPPRVVQLVSDPAGILKTLINYLPSNQ